MRYNSYLTFFSKLLFLTDCVSFFDLSILLYTLSEVNLYSFDHFQRGEPSVYKQWQTCFFCCCFFFNLKECLVGVAKKLGGCRIWKSTNVHYPATFKKGLGFCRRFLNPGKHHKHMQTKIVVDLGLYLSLEIIYCGVGRWRTTIAAVPHEERDGR